MWLLILLISLIVILAFTFIYRHVQNDKLLKTVTQKNRGTWSERDLILRLLKKGISSKEIFHDLYIKKSDGSFSQVDLVLVSEVGLIVIEVKDYSGWIYGSGYNSDWLQVLAYGKQKYRFYNPIFQNESHIKSLKDLLNRYGDIPFYSVIVFYGNCELKKISFVPNGISIVKDVNALNIITTIIEENGHINIYNKAEISELLFEAVINGAASENTIQHAHNIRNMLRQGDT